MNSHGFNNTSNKDAPQQSVSSGLMPCEKDFTASTSWVNLRFRARSKIVRLAKRVIPNSIIYRNYYSVQHSYKRKERAVTEIFNRKKQIKVAFLVMFKSVFPTAPVYSLMLQDSVFDPYIIVIPNVYQSLHYQQDNYSDTLKAMRALYGKKRVINGYDKTSDTYLELKDEYPIIFFCNPYKHLAHPYHFVDYFLNKNVLPVYSSYGFAALKFWDEVIATPFYNYMWKCTIETRSNLEHLKKTEKIKGKNGVVTGYLKMDKLALVKPIPHERKRIMICPHHTVWGWKILNIGNFLSYSQFFLELAKRYPQVDFIFRPHPLLFSNLKLHKVWTQDKIDDYLRAIDNLPNMVYDNTGDYMQTFIDSDAMIHDCGSFIGEYLYTKKPCLYMLKTEVDVNTTLVPLGKECMKQYYHAFCKQDIENFVNEVVLKGNDPLKQSREYFAETELKVNYPNASGYVIELIKKELKLFRRK